MKREAAAPLPAGGIGAPGPADEGGRPRPTRAVVLYTRRGCCLCDRAREVLLRVHARRPSAFALQERDIDSDERLLRSYLERIPVVTIDGAVQFELFVDEAELQRRLGIVEDR